MKTLRLFTIFLGVFAMGQSGLGADAKGAPNLKAGQAALRAKEYKLAVVALAIMCFGPLAIYVKKHAGKPLAKASDPVLVLALGLRIVPLAVKRCQ